MRRHRLGLYYDELGINHPSNQKIEIVTIKNPETMKIKQYFMLESTGEILCALHFNGQQLTQFTIDQHTKKDADGITDSQKLRCIGYRIIY